MGVSEAMAEDSRDSPSLEEAGQRAKRALPYFAFLYLSVCVCQAGLALCVCVPLVYMNMPIFKALYCSVCVCVLVAAGRTRLSAKRKAVLDSHTETPQLYGTDTRYVSLVCVCVCVCVC